jgi:AcrR family transcriptional regulator
MDLSRQEKTPTNGGRSRQKARTRRALLEAAIQLVSEGKPPSIPEAAELALMSPATAYRYFPSAQALWEEASLELVEPWDTEFVDQAGQDPLARLEAVIKTIGWHQLDHEVTYRNLARAGLERWFAQLALPEDQRVPVREGRRPRWNSKIIEPLRGQLPDDLLHDLLGALTLVWGTEAVISLRDVGRLNTDDAKRVMLAAARWMLQGALADIKKKRR